MLQVIGPRWARALTIGLSSCLIGSLTTATAGAVRGDRTREVSASYTGPAYAASVSTPVPSSTLAGYCNPEEATPPSKGCPRFTRKKADRFVSIRISDRTGLPVLGAAVDSGGRVLGLFCAETRAPLALPQDVAHIDVWVVAGTCPNAAGPSVPTTGTITATFRR
jgi:hypothetical protein